MHLRKLSALTAIVLVISTLLPSCKKSSNAANNGYKVKTQIDSAGSGGTMNIRLRYFTYDPQGRIAKDIDSMYSYYNYSLQIFRAATTYTYTGNKVITSRQGFGYYQAPGTYYLNSSGLAETQISDADTVKYQYDAQGHVIRRVHSPFLYTESSTFVNGNELSYSVTTGLYRTNMYSSALELRDYGKSFLGRSNTNLNIGVIDSCLSGGCTKRIAPTLHLFDTLGRVVYQRNDLYEVTSVYTYY